MTDINPQVSSPWKEDEELEYPKPEKNSGENLPMKNLILEHKITSTRTSFYTKDIKFADFIFVDNKVEVIDFKVLPDEVSDHNPIYLEFK